MDDLKAEISFFATKIRSVFAEDLREQGSIPPDAIDAILQKDPFGLSEEVLAAVRRQLEFTFSVRQEAGHAVRSDYEPWLKDRMQQIDFYYWTRLRRYFLEGDVLPPNVVAQLDNVTDEVLDYCGNPEDEGSWSRRGMVMGHVQSGKTTNYASLICKAADAGYKIIILLAGLTNSLRMQTQERIDENFIGKKSLFGRRTPELMPIMTFCDGKQVYPAFGTTRDADFNRTLANQFGVSLANLKDPIIFVTKKNKGILENLLEWIERQAGGQLIQYPLLLVDDEADNASVNTHNDPARSTAINAVIRKILKQFNRSSYVGYTATPFANIFIDPDTEDEMCGDDLFPRHFIKALDPPNNYVGALRVFAPEGDLREKMVRIVEDYQETLPLKHKKSDDISELPQSAYEAIRVFVLVRALRILRGDGAKHCSMMINVSRFNDIQDKVHGLVYAYQKQLDDAIKLHAALGEKGLKDPDLAALKATFLKEFSEIEFDFEEVQKVLPEASASIVVRTVNMRGGALDYEANKSRGLHVIAIGGLALSRGLTLEGLAVSYILRNSAASDTLMQMARWFGYRRNYEDICRLYICQSSVDHYEYIEDAVEELRSELKRMQLRNETPEQFGLKVRRSETGIQITAANKMRNAQTMQLVESFSDKHVEGYALYNDEAVNRANLEEVLKFMAEIGQPYSPGPGEEQAIARQASKHIVWKDVPGRRVLELLDRFSFHPAQPALGLIDGKNSLFSDYFRDRVADELASWDVAIPLNIGRDISAPLPSSIADLGSLKLRARNQGTVPPRLNFSAFKPMGDKNRISDPNEDPLLLLSEAQLATARRLKEQGEYKGDRAFCHVRERPLLLVHLFKVSDHKDGYALADMPVASLSFQLPGTNKPSIPKSYEVNSVFRRQLELLAGEEEDDEGMLDAAI